MVFNWDAKSSAFKFMASDNNNIVDSFFNNPSMRSKLERYSTKLFFKFSN